MVMTSFYLHNRIKTGESVTAEAKQKHKKRKIVNRENEKKNVKFPRSNEEP
jgi:hypothetical protein